MRPTFDLVRRRLASHGLGTSGFEVRQGDAVPPGVQTLVLADGASPALWQRFREAPESCDGQPHPLDRWSRRVIGGFAAGLGGVALFPNDGPPYWPFLAWSERAGSTWTSPLGMLVHSEFGLWYSCRGAIGFPIRMPLPEKPVRNRPCDRCETRPCQSACPVDAFAGGTYDADRCRGWLRSRSGRDCRTRGCLARRACPVGDSFAHAPERATLHMEAFLNSPPIE